MIDQNRPEPIVIELNVEEVIDGAWSGDHGLLPALSSKGESPLPEYGGHLGAYRRAYEDYVRRFSETATRIAKLRTPAQEVHVEAGDMLRPWHEGPSSSFGNPLFNEALKQTPLPTRDEIESL